MTENPRLPRAAIADYPTSVLPLLEIHQTGLAIRAYGKIRNEPQTVLGQ